MRTRSNSKQSSRKESTVSAIRDVDCESLADMSNEAVNKLVRRVKGHGSSGKKKQDNRLQCDSVFATADNGIKSKGKQVVDARVTWNDLDARGLAQDHATK
ncbi:hypothetical protein OIU76_029523 [Salix suchowensis]|nr:hypothetical protein OIU76_029523 [Salix suchowensis]